MDITKHNIIITGGASGFGEYLVNYFIDKAKKIILLDVNKKGLRKFNNKNNVDAFFCDLTNPHETEQVIEEIYKKYPDTSILVNNAGLIHSELMFNLFNQQDKRHSIENWDKYLKVNLSSTFYCSLYVIEQMVLKRIKGLLINISSISANGNAGQSVYSAAKAGVNALTVAWGRELSIYGIRTGGIAPGFFDTPSTHKALNPNIIKKITGEIPLRKLGNLEELAKSVQFIIDNDYFNGKILEIDGGMVLSHG